MIITLKRIAKLKTGVFGVLIDNEGVPFALTAERPDLANKANISCIPIGRYICQVHDSPSKGKCVKLDDVDGRTNILMHRGNIPMKDSEGCILVGEQFEPLYGKLAVLSSRKGFNELMNKAEETPRFHLYIEDCTGQGATA